MDFRKNMGIVLIILGVILTLDRTSDFQGIVEMMVYYIQVYWPLVLSIIGLYILSSPKKRKK